MNKLLYNLITFFLLLGLIILFYVLYKNKERFIGTREWNRTRNMSYDIRGEPIIPYYPVGVFNQPEVPYRYGYQYVYPNRFHRRFHNRYINSKINELISVFSVLKAKCIKVTIDSQTENNFKFNLSAGVKMNGVSFKTGIENSQDKSNKLKSDWELEFFQNGNNNNKININEFSDDKRFYYLPKESEWIDAIRKRLSQNISSDKFTYSYSDTNDIKYKAFTNLQLFNISCDYNRKQFENININYEIEYYPLDTVIIENKSSNSNSDSDNNVIIINNNKDDNNMNILDYVNNFLLTIF